MHFFPAALFSVIFNALVIAANDRVVYYTSLFDSIHNKYGTAGIIMASSKDYQSSRLTIWHDIIRMLSNQGISSALVDFSEFKGRLEFYAGRTVRPLAVILINDMREVDVFEGIAKDLDMSYPVWLVIFTEEADDGVCTFCRNPRGNLFNLKFNSEVIISCCDSNIIGEWWSKAGNETHSRALGIWTDGEIRWTTDQSLYSRRHFFVQREIRVSVVRGSSYAWEKNGELDGMLGEIIKELSRTMNFSISVLIKEPYYGSYDYQSSKWTGVIGRVLRGEVDIGAADFSMTPERVDLVEFTIPLAVGDCRLYVKKLDGAHLQWNAYFRAFKADVWALIMGSILVMPIILTLIKYTQRRKHALAMIIEHYSYVWGIYCQQGLSVFQDSAEYEMFKASNDSIMRKMMALMRPSHTLPQTLLGGLQQVCTKKVAFYTNEAQKRSLSRKLPCDIVSVRTGRIDTLGMIMSPRSEYIGLVNYQ
uniref:KBP_0 protein n=1 Tax=Fopius arisanus TaxID=64838 RepID=A0A0C9RJS9_9HYME